MNILLNIPHLLRFKLSALIMLIDFDYSRLCIVHHEFQNGYLILWLEDAHDMVNSIANCLRLEVPVENLAALISPDEVLLRIPSIKDTGNLHVTNPQFIATAVEWFCKAAPKQQQKTILEILLTSMMSYVMDDRNQQLYA